MPKKAGQITDKIKPHIERVAELYFQNHVKGLDVDKNDLGVKLISSRSVREKLQIETGKTFTKQEVDNVIKYWRSSDRIRLEIVTEEQAIKQNFISREIPSRSLELIEKYSLTDCRLVQGILSSDQGYSSEDNVARSRVIRDLGKAGGEYLSQALTSIIRQTKAKKGALKNSVTICVGPGESVTAAIDQIYFTGNFSSVLVDIVPTTGLLGWRRVGPSPLANARRLEYAFSGDARLHWYSTPAILPRKIENPEGMPDYDGEQMKKALENLPMVKHVDALRKTSSVYIFSVSDAPKIDQWSSDQWHLITKEAASQYLDMRHKAIGAISGLLFDANGVEVKGLPWLPMGLKLSDLQDAASRKKRADSLSVLIVGGHPNRIPAIQALLNSGCVNVLITDLYTARAL